jgi:hypothetical protein
VFGNQELVVSHTADLSTFLNHKRGSLDTKAFIDAPREDNLTLGIANHQVGELLLLAISLKRLRGVGAHTDEFCALGFDGIVGLAKPACFQVSARRERLGEKIHDHVTVCPQVGQIAIIV